MDRRDRALRIASDLRRLLPHERAEALDAACGTDRELRAEVEAVLADFERRDAGATRTTASIPSGAAGESSSALGGEPRPPLDPSTPERIGKYRVLQRIGRGGFGVVYRAISDDGLRKVVALKVLRSNAASANAVRRFKRERQILPSLHHPNISGFVDAGETEDGQPYLVMEYVEGKSIMDYCDENALKVAERLKLFGKVCDAVQHAHARLVLHRDLKPSNILVDRDGTPKLLDFGIARFLERDAEASADLATVGDESAMTPEYASPEQLRGDPLTVASDVYALGVILYELLTGHRPYEVRSRVPGAVAKLVEETHVLAPSEKVKTTEEILAAPGTDPPTTRTVEPNQVATKRGTSIERLRRALSGDLDNIVLTALRKEPLRRYGSAHELLSDLRRHEDGRPVRARGDRWAYRVSKFVRRHRVALGASVIVAVALVVAGIGAIFGARADTLRAQDAAVASERRLTTVQSMLQDILRRSGAFSSSLQARKAGFELVRNFVEWLEKESDQAPALRLERARAENALLGALNSMIGGAVAGGPDFRREAIRIADRAVGSWDALIAADPSDKSLLAGRATALARRALLRFRSNQLDGASDDSARAVVDAEAAVATHTSGPLPLDLRRGVVAALLTRGTIDLGAKNFDAARASWQRAMGLAEADLDLASAAAEDLELAAEARADLGLLEEQQEAGDGGHTELAREHHARALVLRERVRELHPDDPSAARGVLDSLQWTSRTLRDLGRFAESQEKVDRFEKLATGLRPIDPDFARRLSDVSRGQELRGHLREREGDAKQAAQAFGDAVRTLRQAIEIQRDDDPALQRRLQQLLVALGLSSIEIRETKVASDAFGEAIQALPPLAVGSRAPQIFALLAAAHAGMGNVALAANDVRRASEARGRAVDADNQRRETSKNDEDARYRDLAQQSIAELDAGIAAHSGDIQVVRSVVDGLLSKKSDDDARLAARTLVQFAATTKPSGSTPEICDLVKRTLDEIDEVMPPPMESRNPRLVRERERLRELQQSLCR